MCIRDRKKFKASINPSLPKSMSCLLVLSTMSISTYLYMFCDHRAFMSTESYSKVLRAAGIPRYIPLRQSRPYQPRACFLFRLSLRVDPFLRWPALKSFSTHRFQLGNTLKSYSSIGPRIICRCILSLCKCWVGMRPPAVAGDSHPGLSPSCEHRAR